jgi:aspartyl-tRNA(Asn)/glutamyl-tRNA(Gln) amidotransferase subunit C
MQLDQEMIHYLSELSATHCEESEAESLLQDLQKILTYMDQLQEINTEDVEPCSHVLEGMQNVMRPDAVGPTMPREVFLANAPSQIGGMIRVPPVIKK